MFTSFEYVIFMAGAVVCLVWAVAAGLVAFMRKNK